MTDISGINSARAAVRAHEEEARTQQRIELEKAAARLLQEKQIFALQESNRLLKEQLDLLIKEKKDSDIELKKSKRMNWAMFVISIVSAGVAIASMVIAIIK